MRTFFLLVKRLNNEVIWYRNWFPKREKSLCDTVFGTSAPMRKVWLYIDMKCDFFYSWRTGSLKSGLLNNTHSTEEEVKNKWMGEGFWGQATTNTDIDGFHLLVYINSHGFDRGNQFRFTCDGGQTVLWVVLMRPVHTDSHSSCWWDG